MAFKDKSWWHIRLNRKTRHSALIVNESDSSRKGKYEFLDITTKPPKSGSYIKLDKPINNKNDISHVRRYVGSDFKKIFSQWVMKYKIDDKDIKKIEQYLKNKKSRW